MFLFFFFLFWFVLFANVRAPVGALVSLSCCQGNDSGGDRPSKRHRFELREAHFKAAARHSASIFVKSKNPFLAPIKVFVFLFFVHATKKKRSKQAKKSPRRGHINKEKAKSAPRKRRRAAKINFRPRRRVVGAAEVAGAHSQLENNTTTNNA